jgi:hypothetical protein
VPFGVNYLVAPTRTAKRISSQLGRASTLTVVPVPGATVWRSSLATGRLTVLNGAAATAAVAGSVPATAPARVLNGTPAKVGASTAYRLLILAEPAQSGWTATFNGQHLERKTAYGWAQAFVLPTRAGTVDVRFDSGGRHWLLLLELLAFVGVALVGSGAGPHTHRRDTL